MISKTITCSTCNGSGQTRTLVEGKDRAVTCSKCAGTGRIVIRPTNSGIRESKILVEG